MKKIAVWPLVLLLFFGLCSSEAFASELMEDLFESAELGRLEEIVPQDLPLREELIAGAKGEAVGDEDFLSGLLFGILEALREGISSRLGQFFALFLIIVSSAFFASMRQAWFRDSVGDAIDFLSVLALSGISYSALYSLFLSVRESLVMMGSFLSSMLPITGAVYSLSGGVTTATVHSSLFLSALTLMEVLCVEYLVPLLCVSFALSAAGVVSGVDLSQFARFLRRAVSLSVSVLFLILLVLLGVQTVLGASSDSLALRSARFAAANFIPAVGSMFSESAKTVFAAVGMIRTSVGTLGVFAVLWLSLAPLVGILVQRVLFLLVSALASCFGMEREGAFLSDCAQTLGLLSGLVLSCSVFFLVGFAVFSAVGIGG